MNITLETILAKLPMAKLTETIEGHTHPLTRLLPDQRLAAVVVQMILGILGSQTPVSQYEPGTWGPSAADALAADVGGWHCPCD